MSFDSVNVHIMEKFVEEDSDRPQFCEGERRLGISKVGVKDF